MTGDRRGGIPGAGLESRSGDGADLENLAELLADPAAVFQSKNNPNALAVIDAAPEKPMAEVVGWRYAREGDVERIKARAAKEGGQVLVNPGGAAEIASGLHAVQGNSTENVTPEKAIARENLENPADGRSVSVSTHWRDLNNLLNKIKMPGQVLYEKGSTGQVPEQPGLRSEARVVGPTRANEAEPRPLQDNVTPENAIARENLENPAAGEASPSPRTSATCATS